MNKTTASPQVFGFIIFSIVFSLLAVSGVSAVTTISTSITTGGSLYASSTVIGDQGIYTLGAAGYFIDGELILHASTTQFNIALGQRALESDTGSVNNSAFGYSALKSNTTGNYNTALGTNTLQENTTGFSNTAVGEGALSENITGEGNTAVGGNSLQNATGIYNVGLGHYAGKNLTTGNSNMILATATSSEDIANLTTGSQNIIIGNNISFPSATANGQLNIGNMIYGTGVTGTGSTISSGKIGIGTTTPGSKLSVTSGLSVGANYGNAAPANGLTVEGFAGFGTRTPLNNVVISDGGAGGLEINPSLPYGNSTAVRFLSIDRANADAIKDFYFFQTSGGVQIKGSGEVGIGTTTPYTRLHVTSGQSATTTVTVGEIGTGLGSKGCVNMNTSDGTPASFFISAAGTMVVEQNYCR